MVPDSSAEHAPGPTAPLIDWFKGPVMPHRELLSLSGDFAPGYVKSRIDMGTYGSFDLKAMARAARLSDLQYLKEKDHYKEIEKVHPAV